MSDGDLILVVDDEPPIRSILKYMLEKEGFTVQLASNGDDAIKWLKTNEPDLVLLDVMMPGRDGFSVLEWIRGQIRTNTLPVIMLTARGDVSQRVRGLESGANDYLTKPFVQEELKLRVRNMLQLSRSQRDANPLTGLPGNRAITQELQTRLEAGQPFAYHYLDLDNFKAYNDYYGYSRGDRVIGLLSETISGELDRLNLEEVFVGHVGGDDFVVISSPEDAFDLAELIKDKFDEGIRFLYEPEDWERGFIEVPDRTDDLQKFPPVSVTISVVLDSAGRFGHIGKLNAVMAELKKYGKSLPGSVVVRDRRTQILPGEAETLATPGGGEKVV